MSRNCRATERTQQVFIDFLDSAANGNTAPVLRCIWKYYFLPRKDRKSFRNTFYGWVFDLKKIKILRKQSTSCDRWPCGLDDKAASNTGIPAVCFISNSALYYGPKTVKCLGTYYPRGGPR